MPIIEDIVTKLGLKDSKQLLLLAGGAALAGVVLFSVQSKQAGGSGKAAKDFDPKSKDGVLQVLQEMTSSQAQAKKAMKELAGQVKSKNLSLSQACQAYQEMKVADPLEKFGLSIVDFNRMLADYEADAAVQQAVSAAMNAPSTGTVSTEAASSLSIKKIVEVHQTMLKEFTALASQSSKGSRDAKTLTFAAQAIVAAKVDAAFGLSAEDVESAVLANQGALGANAEFVDINVKLQAAMSKLCGMA
eukprot:TRINITY_DN1935_c4_g1_i1.p1 TRINITY_DN1935_c4_g1~~TRINITY_DN1935_c4_g1_i1.p1  ORF type:complete len:246 (-),score=93.33 TRINITY_DN1935_c4_g1_i1:177-914(-)